MTLTTSEHRIWKSPTPLLKHNKNLRITLHKYVNCILLHSCTAQYITWPFVTMKLTWSVTLRFPFIQQQNVSHEGKIQLWASCVNPPWQDCWDGSASTATLREMPASLSTQQQSSLSGPQPIRMLQRWQARARSSFALCRYGCCGLLFSWEKKPGERWRGWLTEQRRDRKTFLPFKHVP